MAVAQEMMQCNNFCESGSESWRLWKTVQPVKDGRISAHDDSLIGRFARLFTAQITKLS